MKICFVTNTLFVIGGVQRVLSVIANGLSEIHDVTIICTKPDLNINKNIYSLSEKIKVDNPSGVINKKYKFIFNKLLKRIHQKIITIKDINILTNIYHPKSLLKEFINYFEENQFDCVIGVQGLCSVMLGIIAPSISSKCIGWHHNTYNIYLNTEDKYYWHQRSLFETYLKNLDSLVVLTDKDVMKYKNELGIESTRIYNPISFYSDEKSNQENKELLFVGRLKREQKGLDYLAEIARGVLKQYSDWSLTVVGSGPDRDLLEYYLKDYGIYDRVKLISQTNEVQKYYKRASIFLATSRWEGFGLVITEAMECGLSVVSFKNDGPSEIITDGVNGFLIDKFDVNLYIKRISSLIENISKRKRIAENAIIRANDFSLDYIIEQWENVISNKN